MTNWDRLADEETLNRTIEALKNNGMTSIVANNKEEAKETILELIPKGAEIMTMTSQTLEAIGVLPILNESGDYNSLKTRFMSMDRATQGAEMQKLGASPEWVIGSVHAVTEEGHAFIASATGSQLPAYAYGSAHVIWVVGTQKIVKDDHDAMKRIKEHTFPLEDARARKVYGMGSSISKVLTMNKEFQPGRITIVFVKENLGF